DRGGYELKKQDSLDDALSLLRLIQRQHVIRWENTGYPSLFLDPRQRNFYESLVRNLFDSGGIRLTRFDSGKLPVAALLSFQYRDWTYFHTVVFNQLFSRVGPGIFFWAFESEAVVKQGNNLDFGRGTHAYKAVFSNETSHNYSITIYKSAKGHRLAQLIQFAKQSDTVQILLKSPSFRERKAKIQEICQRNGLRGAIAHSLRWLFGHIVSWSASDLYISTPYPVSDRTGDSLTLLKTDDIDSVATVLGMPEHSEAYQEWSDRLAGASLCFSKGDPSLPDAIICLTAKLGRLSQSMKATERSSDLLTIQSLWVTPIDGSDIVTEKMLTSLGTHLQADKKRLLVSVSRDECRLRSAVEKAGFKHVRKIREVRIFGLQII
ncbi:MAG: GNAT family N-acetyltransferase, partial [candidate division Zixibacteria bacterium]